MYKFSFSALFLASLFFCTPANAAIVKIYNVSNHCSCSGQPLTCKVDTAHVGTINIYAEGLVRSKIIASIPPGGVAKVALPQDGAIISGFANGTGVTTQVYGGNPVGYALANSNLNLMSLVLTYGTFNPNTCKFTY